MGANRLLKKLMTERGYYSTMTVVAVAAILSIAGTSLAFLTNQDVNITKSSELRAKALQVAEVGVNSYLWKMNYDRKYYETTVDPAQLDWIDTQDGQYRFTVEVPGGRPGVIINSKGRVPIPGTSPTKYIERQVNARIEKKSFAQYLYVTDREALEGTGSKIWFITGDTIHGPLSTNDNLNINGNPVFEGMVRTAGGLNIAAGTPVFQQGYETGVAPLEMPSSNQELKTWAEQDGYYYYGETQITLLAGGSLQITNANALSTGPTGTVSLPANGVIFIDGQAGAKWNANNGDVYVQGTVAGKLTIGSKNNIYITGDIAYNNNDNDLLGLIAENYVFVNHYNKSGSDVAPYNISIRAAIFALNHSFGFERYEVGPAKGLLTITGTIAQRFRGPVGTFSGSTRVSGYSKNYWYDERMLYEDPPHFVEPLNAGFETTSWQEAKGAP